MYTDIFNLEQKVAIISGGGGGLGREAAYGLAEFGAKVVVADQDHDSLKEVERRFLETGLEVLTMEVDVTDCRSVENVAKKTMERFGRIDILINAAGINMRKPVLELDESEWDKTLDINLKGTFICSKIIGATMVKQKQGKIVNMGSVSSLLGHPEHSAYAASKGGVLLFTRVLAMEWAPYNVNVNAIGPAYIKTALTEDYLSRDGHYDKIVQSIPMRRLGTPGDVVGAILYLSSKASDFVTGTILMVDGGRTAD